MASIRERKRKDGSSYFTVQIRVPGCKPRAASYDDRIEAEQFARDVEMDLREGLAVPRRGSDAAALAKFMNEPILDALRRYELSSEAKPRHLNILPIIMRHAGKATFGRVKRSWVKNFIHKMRMTNSPRRGIPYADQSIASMVQTLNVIAKWRADELDVPNQRLPFTVSGIEGEWKVERTRRLSADEERRLMQRLRSIDRSNRYHWRLLVRLALETGARQGEMVGAEWSEVDIDRRLWLIPAKRTKSKKERAVPLTFKAVRIFKLLRKLSPADEARVFSGLGRSSGSVSTCFARYARGAGLEDFHFHDLRHEAAARMALYWRNFTIFELMLILGHTSIKMFQRYANLRGDELAAKLPSGFAFYATIKPEDLVAKLPKRGER